MNATFDGRPVEIKLEGRSVALRLPGLASLWRLAKGRRRYAGLQRVLSLCGMDVRVKAGAWPAVVIRSNGRVARWLS
ncbi:MAG: hypothetical protein AAF612_00800 [Planctomycetota bacterium]